MSHVSEMFLLAKIVLHLSLGFIPFDISNHLVVGITSSALFDTTKSQEIWDTTDKESYVRYQIENENVPLDPGPGFALIQAMLKLNECSSPRPYPIEVVIMSKNESAAGMRIMKSIEHHGLNITRAAFTGGEEVWK